MDAGHTPKTWSLWGKAVSSIWPNYSFQEGEQRAMKHTTTSMNRESSISSTGKTGYTFTKA
jgi:hypothetical protein